MSADPIFTTPINNMPKIAGGSTSGWWENVKNNVIANLKVGGRRVIVIDWPGTPPPRDGRAPSYKEFLEEQLNKPLSKKVMPKGRHRGRPRRTAHEYKTAVNKEIASQPFKQAETPADASEH